MSVQVGRPGTDTDRAVQVVVAVAVTVTVLGMLLLVRAALGDRFDYRTVRVDNQAGLPVQVDAVDGGGGTLGLGEAEPRSVTTFHEVADLGTTWTFVAAYGGREVSRLTVSGRDLAGRGWTVQVPAAATADLERVGFR